MIIVKQIELRNNIRRYFDMVHEGETIIVPRIGNKNVVIISESDYKEYQKLKRNAEYMEMLEKSIKQAEEGKIVVTSLEELESFE